MHYEAHGADEIVMLDISATPDQRRTHAELVTALSNSLSIPLTVGGGIKTVDDAVRLLNAGADKVSLNTAAVRTPSLIAELASKFGRQCVVLAIDAVQSGPDAWEVVVSCGKERTGMDVVEWARAGVAKGAGEILLTSFDRDGTRAGYDCELLRAVTAAVSVPVIASGGASGYEHMLDAFHAGADAVLAASIFHYNEVTCNDLKRSLSNRGVAMRTHASSSSSGARRSFPRGAQCLVPSIDIMDGHVVQLVGGDPNAKKVDAGADAVAIARRFGVAGEVAVVDLNAALGKGNNVELIKQLLAVAPCRVGGGIRTVEAARDWLDAGAAKIVIGTAATPEFLQQLPRDRVVAALDALQGEVVVHGWQTKTGRSVVDQIKLLRPYVGGFLVTFVEREGRMAGIDLKAIEEIASAVYFPEGDDDDNNGDEATKSLPCTLTIAGGVTTVDDLRALDALGAEGQVGMAIYTDNLDLGRALVSPMVSDRQDGLFPTVVTDQNGASLGLVYSSVESVSMAVRERKGVYFSRSRNELWVKGSTSGSVQTLLRIEMDCDRDSLRFVVEQEGTGFCHRPSYYSCFGNGRAERPLDALATVLRDRLKTAPPGSYTAKLFSDHKMLSAKLIEEATELAEATEPAHVAEEAADLLYFALVAATKAGVSVADVENALHRRSLKVSRRPGLAKPQFIAVVDKLSATPATASSSSAPATPSTPTSAPAPAVASTASTSEGPLLRIKGSDEIMSMQPDPVDPAARDIAIAIVKDVRERGQAGLLEQAVRLGDIKSIDEPWILQRDVLEAAYNAQPADIRDMLQRVAGRIRKFAEAQLASLTASIAITVEGAGNKAGQSVAPMDTAGCYAPGGRYPLPSSILMTAIPARVAGCSVVVGASPRPAPITLAAAHVAGVDCLLTVGGAQAIAALAYGVRESGSGSSGRQLVPACDVVVGPGNRFVTAAKQIVSGIVAIDMLAGPSECLVVVDETSDASVAAADLIAQAEHDVAAVPILIAVGSEGIVQAVEREVERQLSADLATADTARQSFLRNGYAVAVATREQAVAVSDRIAPEHLEIHTKEPALLGAQMKHYGAMFVGSSSAEVLGDYGFGPNHTLPTGGTARSFGGLSVFTFLRVRTWIDIADLSTCQSSIRDAVQLAKLEGLIGHSRSAEKRLIANANDSSTASSSSSSSSPVDNQTSATVNFAVPKGRMFEGITSLLTDAGISLKVDARNLRPSISLPGWTVKLLKPRNVVEMLDHGTRDIGFAGADIVQELGANNIVSYFDTRLDPVRIVVAVPPHFIDKASGVLLSNRHYRIATEYVELTRQWVEKNKLDAEIIRTSGSTEVFPPEDADFIVDNTATGTTLRANGLVIYETLMNSSTQLFIHRSLLDNPAKKQQLDNFVMLLAGAQAAREHVLLEFNVPNKSALDSLISLVPSLRRPTVSQLAEDDGFAVRSAIARSSISRLVPIIKAHGGSDVILSRVEQIVR